MKIHEYQGRELFKEYGIPVSEGELVTDISRVGEISDQLGYPAVIKAQVHVGGRGKAGGVKLVKDKEEAIAKATDILGMDIKGITVKKLFIGKAAEIKKEYYLGAILDRSKLGITFMASSEGGVEIEEVAANNPEAIHKLTVQIRENLELNQDHLHDFVGGIFDPVHIKSAVEMINKLYKLFVEKDCSIAEINPLIIDGNNELLAIDAKVNFDDNALFRHPEIENLRDPAEEDAEETLAKEKGLSFVKLEGDIGCMVNGAGLAMTTMDLIKLYGGEPANFLDVGGSSNPQKVIDALSIITANPKIKGILINIFGGITRCDDIANGLMQALEQLNLNVPLVVRLTGTNEEEGREILKHSKINLNPQVTLSDGVKKIIELTR